MSLIISTKHITIIQKLLISDFEMTKHIEIRDTKQQRDYLMYLESKPHKQSVGLFLPFIKEDKILDLGCGSGILLEMIVKDNKKIKRLIGIEKSTFLYKFAERKKIPKTTILNMNFCNYEFPINHYNTIILSSSLHEVFSYYGIKEVARLFIKIYKSLTKKGRLLIYDGFRNDQILANLTINNKEKKKLFDAFRKQREHEDFLMVGNKWITNLTNAFDFIHKSYYLSNWSYELKELYYPLSLDCYKGILYSCGFSALKIHKFPELENIRKIEKDYSVTNSNNTNLLRFSCNCLIRAIK